MKLKHLKLFENFDAPKIEGDLIFDWLPRTSKENEPIQKTIPESLNLTELLNFANEASDVNSVEEAGYFIAHSKNPEGGFNRVIASKLSPISFDLATFDSDFNKVSEFKNVDLSNVENLTAASKVLTQFGIDLLNDE